ncbi:neprilysin-2-like [Leptopilina heterotoma]|uniref:neprilysin-2-like n=1 Tax=Leptopilina heterotoma TaxID=63436 RepID=UPI001CA8559E|nr:neprilysin-2-like [Leptopilina heterotoma]
MSPSGRPATLFQLWIGVISLLVKTTKSLKQVLDGVSLHKSDKLYNVFNEMNSTVNWKFQIGYIVQHELVSTWISIHNWKSKVVTIEQIVHSNNVLQKADWMDSKTKSKAFEKLRSMTIVHPSIFETYTDNEIDEYYTNLEITPGDFLQTFVNITKFNEYQYKYTFRKPVNFSSWTQQLPPINVNAMNYVFTNRLYLSPAILQGIFFNESRPCYMNYGSVGYVIGHEFTHAFDNHGRYHD